jgi:DNA-binding NtrC family response regulator
MPAKVVGTGPGSADLIQPGDLYLGWTWSIRLWRRLTIADSADILPLCSITHAGGEALASRQSKILIVDDDPSHLEIYSMLIEQAGYLPVQALVRFAGIELPREEPIGLVVLDYRLHSLKTSAELAQEIRQSYAGVPIVVLSDLWSLPEDMTSFASAFVRKGQPAKLLETIGRLLPGGKGSVEDKEQSDQHDGADHSN